MASRDQSADMAERILFYHLNEPFGEFSNFAPYPITLDGQCWLTTEHYFQAAKHPNDEALRERIRGTARPGAAKRLAFTKPARPDWEAVRDEVMLTALRAKFTQHPALAALLLSTGDAQLVEHTTNDAYWADGGDGSGANRLGQLLMLVRAELRAGG